MKLRVPNDEAQEIMDGIGGQSIGFLFENMEKMDIQAERRNTAKEKKRADDAEQRAETAESRTDSRADEVQRLRTELEAMRLKQHTGNSESFNQTGNNKQ